MWSIDPTEKCVIHVCLGLLKKIPGTDLWFGVTSLQPIPFLKLWKIKKGLRKHAVNDKYIKYQTPKAVFYCFVRLFLSHKYSLIIEYSIHDVSWHFYYVS